MNVTLSNYLTLSQIRSLLLEDAHLTIDPAVVEQVTESHQFLVSFAKDKLIYGINTGFGPMAQYRINEQQQEELQYNLIRSHSAGLGNTISPIFVKALMISRLNTLLKAKSGVHPEVVHLLTEFINRGIYPVVYEHGSVGASGDLVQLAHLALSLIGEGEVHYQGHIVPTSEALAAEDLQPLKIHLREGLSLINGTSAMTGIGLVNLLNAYNLLNWNLFTSGLLIELVESYDDHYSSELNNTKLHPGQQAVASTLRRLLSDSQLTRQREDHLYHKIHATRLDDKVQEYYSIRCIPQILGPVYDTLTEVSQVLTHEVNSVNDNPVIDLETRNVYHGGNFHGDYVSLAMDKLKIAMTRLTMLVERQLNFLLNDKLNQKLPPFVNLGTLGLNLGMQGAQFVATSTVAENQTLSYPMYLHSIPNNNDNQDIVSMGTNAALLTSKVIDNGYQVLAVQLLTLIQAVDYLGIQEKMSSRTRFVYDQLRAEVAVFEEDTVMHTKLRKIQKFALAFNVEEKVFRPNTVVATPELEAIEVCPV